MILFHVLYAFLQEPPHFCGFSIQSAIGCYSYWTIHRPFACFEVVFGYALSLLTWILIGPSLLTTCESHIVLSRSPNCTTQHGLWGNSNYLALALYLSTSLWGWRRFFYIVWYSWWSCSLSELADQLDQWKMELSRSRREAHQFPNLNVP